MKILRVPRDNLKEMKNLNVTFIKTLASLWLGCVCRTNLVRGEGGLKWVEKGGREAERGGNMTSCPAGSVSSSLDSLEKLFSLQLWKKFWIFLLFWVHYYHLNVLAVLFFCNMRSLPGRFPPPTILPTILNLTKKVSWLLYKMCPNSGFFLIIHYHYVMGLYWLLKLIKLGTLNIKRRYFLA